MDVHAGHLTELQRSTERGVLYLRAVAFGPLDLDQVASCGLLPLAACCLLPRLD